MEENQDVKTDSGVDLTMINQMCELETFSYQKRQINITLWLLIESILYGVIYN